MIFFERLELPNDARVIIKNLQNMHERPLPPTGAQRRMELEYQDRAARLQGTGRGPHVMPHPERLGRLPFGPAALL